MDFLLFDPNSPVFVSPLAGWLVLGYFWFAIVFFVFFFITLAINIWSN